MSVKQAIALVVFILIIVFAPAVFANAVEAFFSGIVTIFNTWSN